MIFRRNKENIPPPLYRYSQPWRPTAAQIAEHDMIQMACPWCHMVVWTYPHSEPVGLAKYYGNFRAQYSGDCSCSACGRGIFFWGLPWVYHAEFDDDGSSMTYYSWEEQAAEQPSQCSGIMTGRQEGGPATPLRTWARSDPDAPTIYTKVADAPPHPCSLGQHQKAWYCSGWSDVPGALVEWRCSRCHIGLGWGRYEDGPGGPRFPTPNLRQIAEWEREGRALMAEQDHQREMRNAVDIEGECNARSIGNRCSQRAGHDGPHGLKVNGIILAPWKD